MHETLPQYWNRISMRLVVCISFIHVTHDTYPKYKYSLGLTPMETTAMNSRMDADPGEFKDLLAASINALKAMHLA